MSFETRFPSVYEFVDRIILPYYGTSQSRTSSVNWSERWWAHKEVLARLEGLWLRYETLRHDEPASYLETFFRVHGDYHMGYLMGERSVLQDCRREDMPTVALRTSPVEEKFEEL
ncbi:DUF4913 domain-containing protein [Corynebacterium phoceense]|uniref:DUF4913 domain-containing protein n=1 Tax=Corynebacterium phoceense TaxID=1686286 RepID=UPI00211BC6DB|nr:DUF4913 domain-containing protein [Corynebacterium phoceense]MCQ9334499.1 DUF4913 domain-containing protein [Corynebacterium phoceense]